MEHRVRDEGGRRFKSCHSDQYLADPQISFPTVSSTDINVLHDAAEGAMRTTARVRRQSHEIESAADFLAKYWQIMTAFQTARMLAQSLSYATTSGCVSDPCEIYQRGAEKFDDILDWRAELHVAPHWHRPNASMAAISIIDPGLS